MPSWVPIIYTSIHYSKQTKYENKISPFIYCRTSPPNLIVWNIPIMIKKYTVVTHVYNYYLSQSF